MFSFNVPLVSHAFVQIDYRGLFISMVTVDNITVGTSHE